MPRSRRGDSWTSWPASAPLPVEGGLASSKQRGPMAETWWSQRFTEVLESYGLGGRMQRGRRYARTGQVMTLDVRAGVIDAKVQGSRRTPYVVTIRLPVPTKSQWAAVAEAMTAKVGFVARLLAGEMPPDLEDVFRAAGMALFPQSWQDLRPACSCPDWESPCKHIAAVLYVFADQLDADPWLLLAWRGRTREEILDALRLRADKAAGATAHGAAHGAAAAPAEEPTAIAPWWPFAAGPLPASAATPAAAPTSGAAPRHNGQQPPALDSEMAPERADAVLDVLEPLDVPIGATSFVDALRPLYDRIVDAGTGGDAYLVGTDGAVEDEQPDNGGR